MRAQGRGDDCADRLGLGPGVRGVGIPARVAADVWDEHGLLVIQHPLLESLPGKGQRKGVRLRFAEPVQTGDGGSESRGGFVFAQEQPWTGLSAVLRVAVAPDRSLRVSALPVRAGFQPRLVRGPAADSVRSRLGLPLSRPAPRP